jgi:hypothetical protein
MDVKEKRRIERRRLSKVDRSPMFRVLAAIKYHQHITEGQMPSYEQISAKSGVSLRVVPDYIRLLERNGYLRRQETSAEKNLPIYK